MLANHAPPSTDSPQGDPDYDIILAALMETARGRSFLEKYALRSRAADTATLLTAIGRIEGLLTAKSLEPVEPSPADAVPPAEVETSPVPVTPADTAQIDAMADVEETDADLIETGEVEAGPLEVLQIERGPVEVVALRSCAIEFLGPELTVAEAALPVASAPPADRTKREMRDPFADIRALSYEEKIALFT